MDLTGKLFPFLTSKLKLSFFFGKSSLSDFAALEAFLSQFIFQTLNVSILLAQSAFYGLRPVVEAKILHFPA